MASLQMTVRLWGIDVFAWFALVDPPAVSWPVAILGASMEPETLSRDSLKYPGFRTWNRGSRTASSVMALQHDFSLLMLLFMEWLVQEVMEPCCPAHQHHLPPSFSHLPAQAPMSSLGSH